jgi:hypothetical protein
MAVTSHTPEPNRARARASQFVGIGAFVALIGAAAAGCAGPTLCSDTCQWAGDGECDDGGEGALYSACDYGSDCEDCGPRPDDSDGEDARCREAIDDCAGARDRCWSTVFPEYYPSCVRTYCACLVEADCLGEAGFDGESQCRSSW